MRALILLVTAATAWADTSARTNGSAPDGMTVEHVGRGVLLRRGNERAYFPLPRQAPVFDGVVQYYAPGKRAGTDFKFDRDLVWLGDKIASGYSCASWQALRVYFESTLARRASEGKQWEAALRHQLRAREIALQPHNDCRNFVDRDQCDQAPIIYRLALYELKRGQRKRAREWLAPLLRTQPLQTYAGLLSDPELEPLFELPELSALREGHGDGLARLKEVRAMASRNHRRAAYYVPEAAPQYRLQWRVHEDGTEHSHPILNHQGSPAMVVFYQPETEELRLPLPSPLAERLLDELGFVADPKLEGPRTKEDEVTHDLRSVRIKAHRSVFAENRGGCEGNMAFQLDWEAY